MQNHEALKEALAKQRGRLNAKNGMATDEFIRESTKEVRLQVGVEDFNSTVDTLL
jgi:hypothetical protein